MIASDFGASNVPMLWPMFVGKDNTAADVREVLLEIRDSGTLTKRGCGHCPSSAPCPNAVYLFDILL